MKKNIYTVQGVTLIELMVSITILTIFVTAFFSSTGNIANQRNQMRENSVEILNLFSNARSMAINSTVVESGASTSIVPQYGYGVYINLSGTTGSEYVFFADTNDNGDGTFGNQEYDENDTIFSSNIFFDKGIFLGTEIEITLQPGNKKLKNAIGFDDEVTILFQPLSAAPSIFYENDATDTGYSDMEIHITLDSILEEKIDFNTISRFFERTQLYP